MAFCNMCGAQIADGTTTCAACASRVSAGPGGAAMAATPAQGLTDNVAGLLAYITIIPAIVFLLVAPYNKNRFVRFHSFQCLFFCAALIAIHIGLSIIGLVPFLGLVTLPLHMLVSLGAFIVWIILLIKASQNQMWKLPIIGDMAEKQANAM